MKPLEEARDWKRHYLPRLAGHDLFPYGGGKDGKAPLGGTAWQQKPETIEEIAARNGSCKCVALYPSKERGIEVFDVDGKTAYDFCIANGVDFDAVVNAGTWKVWRPSDPFRFKLIFRIPPEELEEQWEKGKSAITTAEAEGRKREQIEWFCSNDNSGGGQGAIIAGWHKASGDFYCWQNGPDGHQDDGLVVTPPEFRALRTRILKPQKQKPKPIGTTEEWGDARVVFGGKCPSCGRDSDGNCRATADGRILHCHHGSTFSANIKSPPGTRVEANGITLILRHHDAKTVAGPATKFTIENETDIFIAEDAAIKHEQIEAFRSTLNSPIYLEEIFHPTLANLLTARAASLPTDPCAYVMPLLSCVASIVGKRVMFNPKIGWEEPCVVWGGNVMPPSSLKSPIAADVIRPLAAMERDSYEKCKPNDNDDEDAEPILPRRFKVQGATHAAILELACQEKNIGLVSYHDELASLFAELEKAHNVSMRAQLLSFWSGDEISYDTKRDGHLYAAKTAVSLFGNVQPDKLHSLIEADGSTDNGGDGLWCRFLWCVPQPMPWTYNTIEADISSELADIYHALDRTPSGTVFKFSDAAIEIGAPQWNQWALESLECDANEAAFLGKLRGYSVRIAGILHLLDIAIANAGSTEGLLLDLGDTMVPADAMVRAIRLCKFCRRQWQQLQTELGHGGIPKDVAKLLKKVKAADLFTVSPRDVISWRLLGRSTRTAEAAAFLQDTAETWAIGTISRGRRGSIAWSPPSDL